MKEVLVGVLRVFGLLAALGIIALVVAVGLIDGGPGGIALAVGFPVLIAAGLLFDYFRGSSRVRELNRKIAADPHFLDSPPVRETCEAMVRSVYWGIQPLPFTAWEVRKLKKHLEARG